MKKALITGITGQDGSYLAEFLLSKGYQVHGMIRRVALEDPGHRLWRLRHLLDKIHLHPASLESYASIFNLVEKVKPDECYHLAAQSFVSYSFEDEFSTVISNVNGTMYILSALKQRAPGCRVYFAGSSEMFGKVRETPQNEETPFHPRSPYGISKVAGFEFTRNYREAYNMFACNGMLFNHESPRRGFEFVTRKIASSVAKIKLGVQQELRLGNLSAQRDWGFAPDYVQAMWLMLQQDKPDDYVLGTGLTHSVKEFVDSAFSYAGLELAWEGDGAEEKGIVKSIDSTWPQHINKGDSLVCVDQLYFRPSEVELLKSDSSKLRNNLRWRPKVTFKDLVKIMVNYDLEIVGLEIKNSTIDMLKKMDFDWIMDERSYANSEPQ